MTDTILLKARVQGFAFQRKHGEGAFIDPAQRFVLREAVKRFTAKRELSQRELALAAEAPLAQAFELAG